MLDVMLIAFFVASVIVPFMYWLVGRDGLAKEAVLVDHRAFSAGELPAVCCKTGLPAEVGVAVQRRRFFRTVVEGIVPITHGQRALLHKWQRIHRWSSRVFAFAFIAGFPLSVPEYSPAIEVGLALTVLIPMVVSAASNLVAQRCLVDPVLEPDGSVLLRGVHPVFVRAVQEARRREAPDQLRAPTP